MMMFKLLTGVFSAIFRRRIRKDWAVSDEPLRIIAPDGSLFNIDTDWAAKLASLFENPYPNGLDTLYFAAEWAARPPHIAALVVSEADPRITTAPQTALRTSANGLVVGYRTATGGFKEVAMSGTSARALALLLRQMIERRVQEREEYSAHLRKQYRYEGSA